MNIKRGLLRLWVVLSLIWITGASIIICNSLLDNKKTFIIFIPVFNNGVELELPYNLKLNDVLNTNLKSLWDEMKSQGKIASKNQLRKQYPTTYNTVLNDWNEVNTNELFSQKIKSKIKERMTSRRNEYIASTLIVIAPPCLLFILGMGLFWVIQGFKKQ